MLACGVGHKTKVNTNVPLLVIVRPKDFLCDFAAHVPSGTSDLSRTSTGQPSAICPSAEVRMPGKPVASSKTCTIGGVNGYYFQQNINVDGSHVHDCVIILDTDGNLISEGWANAGSEIECSAVQSRPSNCGSAASLYQNSFNTVCGCGSWADARAECQAYGGDLVVISDDAKNQRVKEYMNSFSDYGTCQGPSFFFSNSCPSFLVTRTLLF